jgi:hypothetical protein
MCDRSTLERFRRGLKAFYLSNTGKVLLGGICMANGKINYYTFMVLKVVS